jgi:hypothetical protein
MARRRPCAPSASSHPLLSLATVPRYARNWRPAPKRRASAANWAPVAPPEDAKTAGGIIMEATRVVGCFSHRSTSFRHRARERGAPSHPAYLYVNPIPIYIYFFF